MIIWGSRGRTSTLSEGAFTCPQCARTGPYRLQESRRWFTLYFIPIFPTGAGVKFVECTTCKTHFQPGVLDRPAAVPPEEALAKELRRATARTMAWVLVRAGLRSPTALEAAAVRYREVTHNSLPEGDLRRELKALETDVDSFLPYLGNFSRHLERNVRERLLASALQLAADCNLEQPGSSTDLAEVASALGLTEAQIGRTDGSA